MSGNLAFVESGARYVAAWCAVRRDVHAAPERSTAAHNKTAPPCYYVEALLMFDITRRHGKRVRKRLERELNRPRTFNRMRNMLRLLKWWRVFLELQNMYYIQAMDLRPKGSQQLRDRHNRLQKDEEMFDRLTERVETGEG